jgi:hypothetical protein
MATWGPESANDNYSRQVDREKAEQLAKNQTKAANAAGRGSRSV